MDKDLVNRLVTREGLAFQSWKDRYGKGVWAALGFWDWQIDVVRDLSDAGDLDMIPAMEYVSSADWLPYVTAPTFLAAISTLEERLASLPEDQLKRGSDWERMVSDAVDALRDATRNRSWYATDSNEVPRALAPLPETFALALARPTAGG